MRSVWLVVVLTGAVTVALKGSGPLLLGGRAVPPRLVGLLELLAPALLAGLVVTSVVGGNRRLVIDARMVGIAVAGVSVWRQLPPLVVVVLAAGATAIVRGVA